MLGLGLGQMCSKPLISHNHLENYMLWYLQAIKLVKVILVFFCKSYMIFLRQRFNVKFWEVGWWAHGAPTTPLISTLQIQLHCIKLTFFLIKLRTLCSISTIPCFTGSRTSEEAGFSILLFADGIFHRDRGTNGQKRSWQRPEVLIVISWVSQPEIVPYSSIPLPQSI